MKVILYVLLLCSVIMAKGKISGVTFFDYTHDLTENAANDKGFSLDKVYFTYKNNISDDVSFKFQTDVGRLDILNQGVNPDRRLVAYLKKAELNWKSPIGKIILGMQGMNVFNITEKNWGFRFIEKSPMDLHGFSSSADMGVGYLRKFSNLNFSVLVTNGTGYKKAEDNAFKKISIQTVYGEKKLVKKDGFNIGASFTIEPYKDDLNTNQSETVIGVFGGYAGNSLRLGAEFDMHADSAEDVTQQIIAFYSSYKLIDNLEVLFYYDMFDPNTKNDSTDGSDKDGETYIIAGVNYYAGKGLIITPNIRLTSLEEGDGITIFKMNFQFKF